MRELQHLDDPSQAPQPPGVSLLRIDPADTREMSEMPVEVCLFLRRRLGAFGRKVTQRISRRTNRAVGSGYGADKAPVPGNARGLRGWCAGHSRGHADVGEGA